MPKRKRKKWNPEALFHLTGLHTEEATTTSVASLENCLEELQGTRAAPSIPAESADQLKKKTFSSTRTEKAKQASAGMVWNSDAWNSSSYQPSKMVKENVLQWNTAFQSWNNANGTYTAGLLPSFDVELARHFQVKELSSFLLKACPHLKMPSFERWLVDSKVEEKQKQKAPKCNAQADASSFNSAADPVLTGSVTIDFESSQRLLAEIVDATSSSRDDDEDDSNNSDIHALRTVRELCRRTTQVAVPEVHSQLRRCSPHQVPLRKGDRIALENHNNNNDNGGHVSLVYYRKKWKKPFCIKLNKSHYDKLRKMFLCVHNHSSSSSSKSNNSIHLQEHGKSTKACHAFHLLVMVMMLRYSSLSGGQLLDDLKGGGMQGAVHGEVFGVLQEFFLQSQLHSPLLECFASPLNAFLPCYHSVFFDIDWHFGSNGDFFFDNDVVIEGCYAVNPPSLPGLMDSMVKRLEQLIGLSNAKTTDLTIVVIVPTASAPNSSTPATKRFAYPSFCKMTSSSSCRLHIVLQAREHGYSEGAQHMRPTFYKDSNYDTSVIVLQSKQARKEHLDMKRLEQQIREAFQSRHTQELRRR